MYFIKTYQLTPFSTPVNSRRTVPLILLLIEGKRCGNTFQATRLNKTKQFSFFCPFFTENLRYGTYYLVHDMQPYCSSLSFYVVCFLVILFLFLAGRYYLCSLYWLLCCHLYYLVFAVNIYESGSFGTMCLKMSEIGSVEGGGGL